MGKALLLLLISGLVIVEIHLAEHSQIKRREIFYGLAARMLFVGLMIASEG